MAIKEDILFCGQFHWHGPAGGLIAASQSLSASRNKKKEMLDINLNDKTSKMGKTIIERLL